MLTDKINQIAREGVIEDMLNKIGVDMTPLMKRVNVRINDQLHATIRTEMKKAVDSGEYPRDFPKFLAECTESAINSAAKEFRKDNDLDAFEMITWVKGQMGIMLNNHK